MYTRATQIWNVKVTMYSRAMVVLLIPLLVILVNVGSAEKTCSQLGGKCLAWTSDIHCYGTRQSDVPGCPDMHRFYCCVPNTGNTQDDNTDGVNVCERVGGRCQSLLSGVACGGTRDTSMCGPSPAMYCCIPH